MRDSFIDFWNSRAIWQRVLLFVVTFTLVLAGIWQIFSSAIGGLGSLATPEEFRQVEGAPASYEIILGDPEQLERENGFYRPQEEGSVATPFIIQAYFGQLDSAKQYPEPEIKIRDRSGKEVPWTLSEPFQQNGGKGRFAVLVKPDPDKQQPGSWEAKFAFDGVGKLDYRFSVTPATPLQIENRNNSQKAFDVITQAMTYYWTTRFDPEIERRTLVAGTEGTLDLEIKTPEKKDPNQPPPGDPPITDPEEYEEFLKRVGLFQEPKPEPVRANPVPEKQIPRFIEFTEESMHDRFELLPVSKADRLNGITFRGRAIFSFELFRFFGDSEWSRWQDVNRPDSQFELAYGRFLHQVRRNHNFGGASFDHAPLTRGLRYECYLQDENWFVISDLGELFVNGIKTERRDPEAFNIRTAALVEARLYQPSHEALNWSIRVRRRGKLLENLVKKRGLPGKCLNSRPWTRWRSFGEVNSMNDEFCKVYRLIVRSNPS